MAARQKVVVQPTKGRQGWDVKTPTHTQHFETKAPAVAVARQTAKAIPDPSQLIIKGRDGKIQTEHTYQHDPTKYPG